VLFRENNVRTVDLISDGFIRRKQRTKSGKNRSKRTESHLWYYFINALLRKATDVEVGKISNSFRLGIPLDLAYSSFDIV
jgi:hypothetical protein